MQASHEVDSCLFDDDTDAMVAHASSTIPGVPCQKAEVRDIRQAAGVLNLPDTLADGVTNALVPELADVAEEALAENDRHRFPRRAARTRSRDTSFDLEPRSIAFAIATSSMASATTSVSSSRFSRRPSMSASFNVFFIAVLVIGSPVDYLVISVAA